MARYVQYHFWCPLWEPTEPPPSLEEQALDYPIRGRWRPPSFCHNFIRRSDEQHVRAPFALSTPERVRELRQDTICATHRCAPDVLRTYDALLRRQTNALTKHHQGRLVRYSTLPENLWPARRYLTEFPFITLRRPEPPSTHSLWQS